jgi:tripartite-type tricarboxylate transporter receptor subunit TctC
MLPLSALEANASLQTEFYQHGRNHMNWIMLRIIPGLCATMLAFSCIAQNYPSRPLKLYVPMAPGGANDIFARIIGQKLSERLGQPVVIDNRPGAGITIGTGIAAKSAPDGYNMLIVNSIMLSASPALYKSLSYDPVEDFVPVGTLAIAPYVLVVADNFPAKTFKEFMALMKANPGKFNYSSSGIGSTPHLIAELFKRETGINVTHVPYKGGGPSVVGLLGGDVAFTFESIATVVSFIKSGKMRLLAVTSGKRMAMFPDAPTVAESGVTGFDVTAIYGLVVPKGTPKDLVQRLGKELVAAMQAPEVKESFLQQGAETVTLPPEDLAAKIKSEVANWSRVIKEAGIKPE